MTSPAPTDAAASAPRQLHTFIAFVEDKPGVLAGIASLFRRRNYNIDSLTVGRTDVEGVSRMTVVVETDDATAPLVQANLYKMVNVLRVENVTATETVSRDLALIKVEADREHRAEVLQIVESFRARVVDIAPEALIIELTGTEDSLQELLEALRPFGILEMVRTGIIAMTRGAESAPADPFHPTLRAPKRDS